MKECRVTKRVGNDDPKSHKIEKERMIIVGRKVDSVKAYRKEKNRDVSMAVHVTCLQEDSHDSVM